MAGGTLDATGRNMTTNQALEQLLGRKAARRLRALAKEAAARDDDHVKKAKKKR